MILLKLYTTDNFTHGYSTRFITFWNSVPIYWTYKKQGRIGSISCISKLITMKHYFEFTLCIGHTASFMYLCHLCGQKISVESRLKLMSFIIWSHNVFFSCTLGLVWTHRYTCYMAPNLGISATQFMKDLERDPTSDNKIKKTWINLVETKKYTIMTLWVFSDQDSQLDTKLMYECITLSKSNIYIEIFIHMMVWHSFFEIQLDVYWDTRDIFRETFFKNNLTDDAFNETLNN